MKVILTEAQVNALIQEQVLNESFGSILEKVAAGILSVYLACSMVRGCDALSNTQKVQMEQQIINAASQNAPDIAAEAEITQSQNVEKLLSHSDKFEIDSNDWKLVADTAVVTVYNAVPEQCNADVQHTASMFTLDLDNPESHRIVALERTWMRENGIKFGDLILIQGTYQGKQDGVFVVHDLKAKKWEGTPKIVDVLVDNNTHYGGTYKDKRAKIYVLTNEEIKEYYMQDMAPQVPRT